MLTIFSKCHCCFLNTTFLPNPSQSLWPPRLRWLLLFPWPVHSPATYWASTLCHALGDQPKQIKHLPLKLTVQRGASKAWDAPSFSPTIRTPPHPQSSHPELSAPGCLTQPASPVPYWLSPHHSTLHTDSTSYYIFGYFSTALQHFTKVLPARPTCKCLESRNQVFCFFQIPPKWDATKFQAHSPQAQ